jgi:hypothetical protein
MDEMDRNAILAKIDAAIQDSETPRWAIPMLLCIRDDHEALRVHLASHRRWSVPAEQVVVAIVTAVAVTVSLWLLAGRLPAVFAP